ncbi:MAG: hypothetical protein BLM47_06850 [Candidatus Reconcilbacillus cellulovorans]|uniref:MYXO-CTERM domain-containing protein n=1 Tax=Candidatus Reconcilbacillus cellulovorans TaxID=1906605 RepID=A0A2A6E117_9BACL|nr:MAG: hypothetical protein BLM47_06850 [Candidatus Reconcilbacillus cellulovorans]
MKRLALIAFSALLFAVGATAASAAQPATTPTPSPAPAVVTPAPSPWFDTAPARNNWGTTGRFRATATNVAGDMDWGWLGILGLLGLIGLAGRNRGEVQTDNR